MDSGGENADRVEEFARELFLAKLSMRGINDHITGRGAMNVNEIY